MLWNLLTSAAESVVGSDSEGKAAGCAGGYGIWIMVGIFAVIMFAMSFMSKRSQKKRQEEVMKEHQALRPGNKVKTIGGICGVVVEICPEDNTFVLETGTEASGKSYLKFDMQAIYMSDALATQEAPVEGSENEAPATEEPVFEEGDAPVAEETAEAPAQEKSDEE
ncbi:MAG: preprotein translocase subunit YajC [Clostridia bacterium]|nr:preprotein translocase subunit YajC [Clostridia bacterium]